MPHSFEDYDKKASTYTSMRRAIGWERQLAYFEKNIASKPLNEQALLDAGCGTGNYMMKFVQAGAFAKIYAADYNGAMLEEAKKNLANMTDGEKDAFSGQVEFGTLNIADMSGQADGAFDAVCNNQVVHHLRSDNDLQDFKDAAKEFCRVLAPGGRLCINWCPPHNCWVGMFWAELIPDAYSQWARRTPSKEKMQEILENAGFVNVVLEPLYNEILFDTQLYTPQNMLKDIANFSRSDSTFNLSTPEELAAAVAKLKKMQEEGTLDAWWAKKEAERKATGQTMTVYAEKAPASAGQVDPGIPAPKRLKAV